MRRVGDANAVSLKIGVLVLKIDGFVVHVYASGARSR